jgi:hypothetical protein
MIDLHAERIMAAAMIGFNHGLTASCNLVAHFAVNRR